MISSPSSLSILNTEKVWHHQDPKCATISGQLKLVLPFNPHPTVQLLLWKEGSEEEKEVG
jgi:hypothetical protein